MAAPRIRRVSDRQELDAVRDNFTTQGYEVIREGGTSQLLRRADWGKTGTHVLIAIFTIWWTFGIANLVYALVAHNGADQVILKLDVPRPAKTPEIAPSPEAAPALA